MTNDFKNKQPMDYVEYLKTQYDTALDNASTARTKAINDAAGMYTRALSTHGARGAAMSNMGLQGSGYAQYLDSQAYAQRNSAITNANIAESNAIAQANADYNTAYQGYLQQLETNRVNAFNNILTNIGNYSLSDLMYVSKEQGLNANQNKYLAQKILDNNTYTKNELEAVKDIIGEDAYQSYLNNMSNIDTSSKTFYVKDENGNTGLMDALDAQSMIDGLQAAGVNPDTITDLKAQYDNLYGIKTVSGITLNINAADRGYEEGDNFTIKDAEGKTYRVESGGAADNAVSTLATQLNAGTVFMYQGNLYLKTDSNGVVKVRQRPTGTKISKLLEKFANDNTE